MSKTIRPLLTPVALYRLTCLSLLLAAVRFNVVGVVSAGAPPALETFECGGLKVRDQKGNVRLEMKTSSNDSAGLIFYDEANRRRASIGVVDGISRVLLSDGREGPRLGLGVDKDGLTRIHAMGAQGKLLFEITVLPNNTVEQFFYDADGNQRIKLVSGASGPAIVSLSEKGGERIRFSVHEGREIRQSLFDLKGNERVVIEAADLVHVSFLDANRKIRAFSALSPDGSFSQEVRSKTGEKSVGIYSTPDGDVKQVFYGREGHRRVQIASPKNPPYDIRFFGDRDFPLMGLGVDDKGIPYMAKQPNPEVRK